MTLGGEDPADGSEVTLKASRFQGCVNLVTINGVDLLITTTTTKTNVKFESCATDYLPADPCKESPPACENSMACIINQDDYKGISNRLYNKIVQAINSLEIWKKIQNSDKKFGGNTSKFTVFLFCVLYLRKITN